MISTLVWALHCCGMLLVRLGGLLRYIFNQWLCAKSKEFVRQTFCNNWKSNLNKGIEKFCPESEANVHLHCDKWFSCKEYNFFYKLFFIKDCLNQNAVSDVSDKIQFFTLFTENLKVNVFKIHRYKSWKWLDVTCSKIQYA